MRLATDEFIRRFLIHVLPDGFHRIRHYGFLASAARRRSVATIRVLLADDQSVTPAPKIEPLAPDAAHLRRPCPCCGGPMRLVERFQRGQLPHSRAPPWGAS